jgi:AcrR family transcriptional regulator
MWAMASPAPRGRHAPPLEVRRDAQRARLLEAAGQVFSRLGFAEATAEAVARQAGMSKATFYEHFANKEECMLALFDHSAQLILTRLTASLNAEHPSYEARLDAGFREMLDAFSEHPEAAQTLLVEIIGAGPRAADRRDAILDLICDGIMATNLEAARRFGFNVYAAREDAFAVVGAIVELIARHLRHGKAEELQELRPVCVRLTLGILSQGKPLQPA